MFESLESKTKYGKAVFNKISFKMEKNKDIWIMNQSHHGIDSKNWDTIKIIVHKTSKPYTASFHQLDKKGNEIKFKTNCIRCHAGGPRLIRPKQLTSYKDKLKNLAWNFRIKSYGEVKNLNTREPSKTVLEVNSCTRCHRNGGVRAPLTKDHVLTMKHLVKHKQMPPWPYSLTKADKKKLQKFIYGF